MANDTITPHQPTIEPPEGAGWQVHSPHGSQRYKEGPDGLVVRLADVVRWLMQAREMAFADAVRAICAPLESDSPPLVYRLDPIEKPIPEDQPSEWFKFLPDCIELDLASLPPSVAYARLAAADMRASWLMTPRELERLVNAPECTTYDGTKETPFEFSERADRTGGPKTLAVTFAAAHALWGWGTVAAVASTIAPVSAALGPDDVSSAETLVRYRQQFKGVAPQKRPPWTSAHRAYLAEAVRFHGGAAELAKQLGVSAQAVRDQFNKASVEAETRKQANAFTGLVQRSNKAA